MKVRELVIHHPDGSYEPKRTIIISSPNGKITLHPGARLYPGGDFMGITNTELLDMEVD